jgi:tetratricopeptide (TPR) repeat protein
MPLRKSTMIDPLKSLQGKQTSHLYGSQKKHQQFAVVSTLMEKGQYSRALNLLRIIRVPSESRQDFHCLMGRCYKALGHFPQAFQQFQAALQIDPDCQDAREAIKSFPKPPVLQEERSSSQVSTISKVLKWLNQDVRF